jgi:serine/threonine-protein kinase
MGTDARNPPHEGTLVDGRYLLGSLVGEGTFGGVWHARDTRLSNRPVAVKFLKAEFLEQAETVARFDAEADALAQVPHHNIVAVLDRGTWSSQRFIVTEYVEGRSLAQWIEEHHKSRARTDLATVLALFDQLCAGLEAAHSVRTPGAIVHRDVKPDNVILRTLPNGEVAVKVLDFGIAQLGRRSGTQSGALLGTPLYMAPEQAFGNNNAVGPWTDVFALGVIVTEMLTLQAQATSTEPWWGTALQHPREVRAILGRMRADVPAVLWDVVAKCLQSVGADRYPDAGALRAAMRQAAVSALGASSASQLPWAPISVNPGAPIPPSKFAAATAPTATPSVTLSEPPEVSISSPGLGASQNRPATPPSPAKPDWTHEAEAAPPVSAPPAPAPVARVSNDKATAPPSVSPSATSTTERDDLPWAKLAVAVAFGATVLALGILALLVKSDHRPTGANSARATIDARPASNPTTSGVAQTHGYMNEPGASALTTNPELRDFVDRWSRAVGRRPQAQPLGDFYAPQFRYQGRSGQQHIEAILEDLNDNVREGGSFSVDMAHSEWIEEPLDLSVVPSACREPPDASGNVIKVRPWVVEVRPRRIPSIGCQRLEGRYILRLRRTAAGLRICHESWSQREGICASCPTARECNR